MAIQKFLNLEGLSVFLDNLKRTFSPSAHTHTTSEITDLTVDSSLSATSTNPVQNSTVTTALDQKVPTTRTINNKSLNADINLTANDVDADPAGAAATAVTQHNVATDSHNDIRLLVSTLTTRLNALANSDDETLDQLSEIVAYIKSNKDLIDAITTSKVSVDDIVNDLTTSDAAKVLSAEQGVALKTLIDELETALETVHVQADWNVNDETDPRYVHGRTHWVEEALIELMPEQTVAFAENGNGGAFADSPVSISLEEGKEYVVTWDGVRYKCTGAVGQRVGDNVILVIGNCALSNVGEDTGEPFLYMAYPAGNMYMWEVNNTEAEHTIGVSVVDGEIVHPLDEKFLPESVKVQPDWSQTDETAPDYIKNKPDKADALELIAETGLVEPMTDENGSILTDENGAIYTLI